MVSCDNCGVIFHRSPNKMGKYGNYCDRVCSSEGRSRKMKVVCAVCSKVEMVAPNRARRYKTCSMKCLSEYSKAEPNVKCGVCGKEYHLKPSRIPQKHLPTCSTACLSKLRSSIYLGENNPNYRAVKYDYDGYEITHEGGRVDKKHIFMAKKMLGVDKIPEGFVVHHRNNEHTDNVYANLAVLSASDHTWLHKSYGKFILSALMVGNIELSELLNLTPLKDVYKAAYLLQLNIIAQKEIGVIKSCELLESLEEDNQQPSVEEILMKVQRLTNGVLTGELRMVNRHERTTPYGDDIV